MKKVTPYLILLIVIFLAFDSNAQCSMCRAVAESGSSDKDLNSIGEQLNIGILFLMAIPYVFILVIPLVLFRKKIGVFFKEMRGMYK